MKRLERPNGYFSTIDPVSGQRIEGETRNCVHCGFMWIYNPSESFKKQITGEEQPVTRGKCLGCFGLVCARPECLRTGCVPMMKQIEEMEKTATSSLILLQ